MHDLITKYRLHEQDTGSAEFQVVKLTGDIERLTRHFKSNSQDFASKRGMIKMISQRKKALAYLQKHNAKIYKEIIKDLGIRG